VRWGSIAAGISVYAAALIATAPATLADAGLQRSSGGQLRLAEAQGTLWAGSGQLEIRDTSERIGLAMPLSWRLRPDALLRAQFAYEVEAGPGTSPFSVLISWPRIELANAAINLPAAALGLGVPKLASLGLTGDMLIHLASLSISRDGIVGNATLQWRAAGSALTPVSPLGDYEAQFKASGASVRGTLSTRKGPLQIEGHGVWSPNAPPSFSVVASVPAQYQEQLAPLLRLIAVERSAGSFELSSSMAAFSP